MAAFDFPANPTQGQSYTANGVNYVYNGYAWIGGPQPAHIINFAHLPEGMIFQWALDTVPLNCLELNGQLVSRATYSKLFALFGTKYGAGDGSTTFALPNMAGATAVGRDPSQTRLQVAYGFDARAAGNVFGAQQWTLTLAQMASHAHTTPDHLHGQTQHTHGLGGHTHSGADHWHYHGPQQHSIAYSNATSITINNAFVRGAVTGASNVFSQNETIGNTGWTSQASGVGNTGGPSGGSDWSAVTTTGASDRSLATDAQGGGGWHGNVQPSFTLMFVITTGGQ